MRIFGSCREIRERFGVEATPELWTAVIPAAGKGTRLGWMGAFAHL